KHEMQRLADADAKALQKSLEKAIQTNTKKVMIATHIPPFTECCWHEDHPSDENWLPYFSSKASGDVISTIAKRHPNIHFVVVCGHTHTAASVTLFENLEVKAGAAQYYSPEIQETIFV
ncbi:MAG: hypothetical protein Q8L68_07655, partial [Methylococcales bacterium]|nr:hypothetical protein [Methylococcales bacterium]